MNIKIITYVYLTGILLAAVIPLGAGGSGLNNNETAGIRWDYLLHAFVYIPLPIFLKNLVENKWLLVLISLIILSGLEAVQLFIPYRGFNLLDMAANGVGVIAGLALLFLIRIARIKANCV